MAEQQIDHVGRAEAAWPILVRRARAKAGAMSHGELRSAIGVHHRAAAHLLGIIQAYCSDNGLPKLQALAVNKRTGVRGGGYAGHRGRKEHLREIARVMEHSWKLRPVAVYSGRQQRCANAS